MGLELLDRPLIERILAEAFELIATVGARVAPQAVDLLRTTSSLLTPQVVGERHYNLVGKVQAIMQKYESLKNIIAIVGENAGHADLAADQS